MAGQSSKDRRPQKTATVEKSQAFIPWDSPEVLPFLLARLAKGAEDWSTLAMMRPAREDRDRNLAVARVLKAVDAAVEADDRGFLEELAKIAARYLRRQSRTSNVHGVEVTSHGLDVVHGERHEQLEFLVFLFKGYLRKQVEPGTMARYFVSQVLNHGSPLQLEIEAIGVPLRGEDGLGWNPEALKKVQRAFEKELMREPLRGEDRAERLIAKGLDALGYPGRDVFSFMSKRLTRATN